MKNTLFISDTLKFQVAKKTKQFFLVICVFSSRAAIAGFGHIVNIIQRKNILIVYCVLPFEKRLFLYLNS